MTAEPIASPRPGGFAAVRSDVAIALIAAVALGIAYLLWAAGGRLSAGVQPIALEAASLGMRQGAVANAGRSILVGGGNAPVGMAAASLRSVAAASYDVARVELTLPPESSAAVAFLWWRSDQPNRVFSIPLESAGTAEAQALLAGHPDWRGYLVAVGVGVLKSGALPVKVDRVTLARRSALGDLHRTLESWLGLERWSGRSINFVTGGKGSPRPWPAEAIGALAVGGLAVAGILAWRRKRRLSIATVATVLLVAWVLLDLRWQWNLLRIDAQTAKNAAKPWAERRAGAFDGGLFLLCEEVKKALGPSPQRVLVFSDVIFIKARAAYNLLPHNAYYHRNSEFLPKADRLRPGDYLLLVQKRNVSWDASRKVLSWDNQQRPVELVLERPGAFLYRVL